MRSPHVGKIPQTYSPKELEGKILDWWSRNSIYMKVKERLRGKEKFYFLDGPPYVTNPPHVGTAWNKILKDVVIRYYRMRGYDVRDQPGYDCHGLPIEVKVEEDLKIRSKREIEESITIRKFIEYCKRYAEENIQIQTRIFKDLGVWMDWDNPYLTYTNEYIESVWWVIKRADEKGLLQKGLKVVHWCPRCETALAGYEVTDEYRIIRDQSIYVKFPLEGRESEYILIWTTTPWTLPANVAIMVNPDIDYLRVRVGGEVYILAEARRQTVIGDLPSQILETVKGEKLEGLKYRPPLLEEVRVQSEPEIKDAHRIVLSKEYVSMEEGTGCVHCAPGHGEEDFEVGQKYNLPTLSPVDQAGRFTYDAGKYSGKYVFDANPEIVEDLKRKSLLFKATTVEHPYPHCWRCKTPLILRATEQWFIKITELKNRLFEENEKVRWVPEWAGSRRFRDWLLGARDWVISRQRYWGTPLPIWICRECGRRTVIGSEDELKIKAINIDGEIELHRQDVDPVKLSCECGGQMDRVPDIIDVWMDSGAASWASLRYPKEDSEFNKWWPADLIIEAHDQTRGWFYSQLGASIIAFDKAPYRAVLMHSHTLDSEGQKMSKSQGNFISPQDVTEKYGRDALRLYELQRTIWEDFNFSTSTVEGILRELKVIWNVYTFASTYMSLDKFKPVDWPLEKVRMRPEDRWLTSKTESLKLIVKREMEDLNIHRVARLLSQYAVENLSRWYIKLVRRRFWQEKESPDKMAAYTTLYHALKTWILLSAPFIPFIAEKLYQTMVRPAEPTSTESIHMSLYPEPNLDLIDVQLEESMELAKEVVGAVLSARQAAKVKLRQPISRIIVVTGDQTVERSLSGLDAVIRSQANTRKIEFVNLEEEEKLKRLTVSPNYKVLGPTFRKDTNIVAEELKKLDGRQVLAKLRESGSLTLEVEGKTFQINPEMITFKEEMPESLVSGTFSKGRIYIDLSMPEQLRIEGLVRDIVRRIQEMRRQLNLPVDAYIHTYIQPPSEEERRSLSKNREYICEEVRAKKLVFTNKKPTRTPVDLWKEWMIDGKSYSIGVHRIEVTEEIKPPHRKGSKRRKAKK
ncbi:MAG: isoleucine--tRNA ligase [Candidatus Bathyarchaeia archaeon]